MAIDNRLQVFNEEGQSVDYDILASDVKFLPDGKDLPTKLAELEQEIEDAGSGDGTVTGVKVGSTTYPPNGEGVVDISPAIPDVSGKANKSEMSVVPGTGANADKTTITLKEGTNATVLTQHQDISGKVDKETGKVLIPSTDLAKLQSLPTATELTQQLGAKANDADVVKGIRAYGSSTNLPKSNDGIVTLPESQGGLTKEDISVETQGNGTVDINVGSGADKDTYTINLNHTHEGMAKLIVVEDVEDLPSQLAEDTIYGVSDGDEISVLYVGGIPFYGGGSGSSTSPVLREPAPNSTIFVGINTGSGVTKSINVKGKHLTQDLTLEISNGTGFAFDSTQANGVTFVSSTEVTVSAAAATSTQTNGVGVVVKYTGTSEGATAQLDIVSTGEIDVSCELTASYEQPDMTYTEQEARAAFEDSTLANKWINANGSTIGSPPVYVNNNSQRTLYILKIPLSGVAVLKYPMFKSSEGLGSVICDADGNVVWKFSNSRVSSGSMNTVDVSNITDASYALIQLTDNVTGYTIETSGDLYYGITDNKANTAAAVVDATGYCLSNVYVLFNHNYKVYTGFTQSPDTNNKYGFRCYTEDGNTYATMFSVDNNVDQNGVMNFNVGLVSVPEPCCGVATFKMSEIDDCYIYDATDDIYLFRGKNVTTNNNNN